MKTLEWFKERIGKRIYRDPDSCECATCKEVVENGLVIINEQHANYVYDTQNDFAACGTFLNYREATDER